MLESLNALSKKLEKSQTKIIIIIICINVNTLNT